MPGGMKFTPEQAEEIAEVVTVTKPGACGKVRPKKHEKNSFSCGFLTRVAQAKPRTTCGWLCVEDRRDAGRIFGARGLRYGMGRSIRRNVIWKPYVTGYTMGGMAEARVKPGRIWRRAGLALHFTACVGASQPFVEPFRMGWVG